MYIYYLFAKSRRGEKLTPEEREILDNGLGMISHVSRIEENERSASSRNRMKKLGVFAASVAVGIASLYGVSKAFDSLDEYNQRPEVQEKREIHRQKIDFQSTVSSLEKQAQNQLDYSVQAGIAGETEKKIEPFAKAKRLYKVAIDTSMKSEFYDLKNIKRLERNLEVLN